MELKIVFLFVLQAQAKYGKSLKWSYLLRFLLWVLRIWENIKSQVFRSQFQTRSDSDELNIDNWDMDAFQDVWNDNFRNLQVRISRTAHINNDLNGP